ncbi:MAG: HAMP domain-containing histidine kinase [Clostridiales bacterium]|nr:HAMP domain-containing histidine kinase [Clostridiales bacterium]
MKVRKSIKKPKFILAYLGSLLAVTIILACMGLIVFGFTSYMYNKEAKSHADHSEAETWSYFDSNLLKVNIPAQDIVGIKNQLVEHFSESRQRFKVYSGDEIIADSSQTMLMYYYKDDDYRYLEVADKKYLEYFKAPEFSKYWKTDSERYSEEDDEMRLLPKFYEGKSIDLVVRKAYINIKDCKFIPVVCEVYDHDNHDDGTPTGPVVSIPFEKGSNIPDGYTLYSSNAYFPSYSATIQGFDGADNDNEYLGMQYVSNAYKYYGIKNTRMEYIPFTTVYGTQIRNGICLTLAASLVLGIIPATIVYNIQRRKYDIFEYRRKMTDAMAHDLKSPMAAISACAENLSDNIDTENKEYYAGKIQEKVAQMNKMVNDILEFSKSENSLAVINKQKVDVGGVIAKALADNDHTIIERALKINCEKKTIEIQTDLKLFSQAISNLINNAVLYSKEDKAIDITFDENSLVISNIPKEKIDDAEGLKQPFVKGSAERGTHGSGLGLAIAENNLAILGFKLIVSSDEGRFVATVKL